MDWEPTVTDLLTLQGDYFSQRYEYPLSGAAVNNNRSGNVLQRWEHSFSERASLRWQAYYDYLDRNAGLFHERRHTGDLDLQHGFGAGDRHQLLWGVGYRVTGDTVTPLDNNGGRYFAPESASSQTGSAFLQDEITLIEDRWKAVVGSKCEHNDFTGLEVQPGLRMVVTPAEGHVLWGAVSRAVRTPSREEFDLLDRSHNTVVIGNPGLASESLMAYELGYRFLPRPHLSFDLSVFYNAYDRMRVMETVARVDGVDYRSSRNDGFGETHGVELAASWRVLEPWRLSASYTLTEVQLHLRPGVVSPGFERLEGNTPQHQFQVHSYLDLPAHFELDQALYYVGDLPNQGIPGYFRYDLGLGWRPKPWFEARLGFQSLLSPGHYEFGEGSSEVERSILGQILLRF